MSVIDDRIVVATEKFEDSAEAAQVFKNGDDKTVIKTDSGDLPSLKKWLKDIRDNMQIELDGGTF